MMPGGKPHGPRGPQMGLKGKKADKKTILRLLSYMKEYKVQLVIVALGIILSAVAGVAGSMFIKTLIDSYIEPMLASGSTDYSGLVSAILTMGGIYLIGLVCTFV